MWRRALARRAVATATRRRPPLHLIPARQLHPGFIAAAVGVGLAYAARRFTRFMEKPSDPNKPDTSSSSSSSSSSASEGFGFGSAYVRRVRAAAEEQEKRYAKAADEYWNYQLFMAQRAREFRERAERAKASRMGQHQQQQSQYDHSWQWQYHRPNTNAGRFRHWTEDPDAPPGAGGYSTYTGAGSSSGGGSSTVSTEVMSARRVLGLSPTAAVTEEAVKTAFHAKAMSVHPDRPNGSAAEFRRVNAAYQTLIAHTSSRAPASSSSSSASSASSATHRRPSQPRR